MTEPTQELIQEFRNTFLDEFNTKGESVHPADLERIKSSDDWIKRFLMHHDCDQKEALNMLWETVKWRRDFKTNEINETNVKMEYLIEGGFFSHGRDEDGCALFIFKCKKHERGTRNMDDLKRCVVYWMERLERQEKGKSITLFFDMDGCGLKNMDLEFTKYLIGLFKLYYPFFLNYIIILEMAWILNAAFKVIKSLLPEKAVKKLKMIKKAELKEFVPIDQQLQCWGGTDDYVFSFMPETPAADTSNNNSSMSNKKVHFADGSPMSDILVVGGEKENDGPLSIRPSNTITFIKEGNELVSTLEIQNIDSSNISYKMKTTSPEKFRVRPSAGCLAPNGKVIISITLLHGFQLGGLSRDKFQVSCMQVESTELSSQELVELWKSTKGKNTTEYRLGCTQKVESRNGTAVMTGTTEIETSQITKLSASLNNLTECQKKLHSAVQRIQLLQFVAIGLIVFLGLAMFYIMRNDGRESNFCYKQP